MTPTGITGFVARHLGVTPIVAAGVKYLVMGGLIFGGYHAWKAGIKDDIVTDIVIDEQAGAIEAQQQDAEDTAEDGASKDKHEVSAAERELTSTNKFLRQQSARLQVLEAENAELKAYVDGKPCLREPWSDGLQRRGGFDINQGDADQSFNPNPDRSRDPN